MPLECTSKGARSECLPECRKQTLSNLTRIEYPSSSGKTPGFEGGKKYKPAVVVMQERWGVNDAIKETAMHIAEQGYRVLIPDLYRGRVAVERMEAIGLASDLNWTRGVDDVVKAVEYLKNTGSKKVAIMGFCQGGGMALCGAQFAKVDAAIPFYGIPSNFTGCNPLLISPSVPVQAHFGTNDTSFPASRVLPLFDGMKAAGADVRLYMYDGLPHAFFNAITPAGRRLMSGGNPNFRFPNETLVTMSFSRMTNFLRLHIRY
ncbi:hypothetical protein VOLCADRAFT_97728 [Volvox carteri f. nagariensis]|uniref:Dienelactone hydrolase domain-containing protein n=1 Tax=Volvox carteri f. nagariensis TaxID=3068 RepID=D8UDH6_VOLCA|nr:uncharacterized protein VOLCADRAFT_97728 [Volvox carteri f. nagariensis]EFJ42168.1 hypothetical protein VOLCADRAFT_97728 [Volvox carteri f. nagariensis]|eukprot:XP_002956711.1 hypothetical protein VOLCADRAFT_97728 [Volvox carteri f. nagariensis]